jgi:hypothetical protein
MNDPAQIHTLRITHSMLRVYKLTLVLNSDFCVQIHLEILHSFMSFIMSMYVGMTERSSTHITNSEQDSNCIRVVTHF